MGCCLSTTVTTPPTKSPDGDAGTLKLPESDVKGGARPPALLVLDDEETVKEVLSETQTPISTAPSTYGPKIPIQHTPTLRNSKLTSKVQLEPSDRLKETIKEEEDEQEEISVVSEMYSISGSFSATTVNDGEESGEVNQRISIHHSQASKRSNNSCVNARAKYGGLRSRESSNSREITRGTRSPGPSSQVKSRPRPAQGRTAVVQRRNVGRRDRDWQGLVECSAQRLGSRPAAVSEVMRHQRTAVSGVTGYPGERSPVRKIEESKRTIENHDGAVSRESLDNPRVSLECFIFL